MNDLIVVDGMTEEEIALLNSLDLTPEGVENLKDGDVGMPARLRVSSQNRPMQINDQPVTPGLWVNTLTGHIYEQDLHIVVLMYMLDTRVMWPEKFDSENSPVCKSNNGAMPDGENATAPLPGPCNTCPMGQFVNGEKPQCTRQRNFLVWVIETQEPAILTMQSTSLKSARTLTALAQRTGLRKSIFVSTITQSDSRGTWVVPTFIQGDPIVGKEILQLAQLKNELKNLVVSADIGEYPEDSNPQPIEIEADEVPF